jgi:hypothetical protein
VRLEAGELQTLGAQVMTTAGIAGFSLFGLGIFCHGCALSVYDTILRAQFERARSVWEQRGSEVGYNWAPPGTSLASRFLRMPGRQSSEWLLATPDWAKPYPDVTRRIRLFRILEWVFVGVLVALLVAVIIQHAGLQS